MEFATAEWESVANVDFIYDASQDGNCQNSNSRVTFAVRPWSGGGACAFFPSGGGCLSRTIVVDYADLDTNPFYKANAPDVTSVGVLTHELGHVLGFRHEHTRPETGACFEDYDWRQLTAYDATSVMHYPWCRPSPSGDLVLTPRDFDGVVHLYGQRSPSDTYTDSYEAGIGSWNTWQNCPTDANWSVSRYYTGVDNPPSSGGLYAMRMHSTGFVGNCQNPGVYAESPKFPAQAGTTYYVDNMSRNGGNTGYTTLIFINSAGVVVGQVSAPWNSDSWVYNADSRIAATAPVGTVSMRIRYELLTPNAYADLDLLRVFTSP